MLNATLVGRLGRDPETRTTQSGKSITSASVAYDTGWGERKATTWIKVEIWGNRGEKWAEYHQKGSTVIVHGSVKMDTYTGRDGVEKQSLVMEGRDWEFAGKSQGDRQGDRQQSRGSGGYDRGGSGGGGYDRGGRQERPADPGRGSNGMNEDGSESEDIPF